MRHLSNKGSNPHCVARAVPSSLKILAPGVFPSRQASRESMLPHPWGIAFSPCSTRDETPGLLLDRGQTCTCGGQLRSAAEDSVDHVCRRRYRCTYHRVPSWYALFSFLAMRKAMNLHRRPSVPQLYVRMFTLTPLFRHEAIPQFRHEAIPQSRHEASRTRWMHTKLSFSGRLSSGNRLQQGRSLKRVRSSGRQEVLHGQQLRQRTCSRLHRFPRLSR